MIELVVFFVFSSKQKLSKQLSNFERKLMDCLTQDGRLRWESVAILLVAVNWPTN